MWVRTALSRYADWFGQDYSWNRYYEWYGPDVFMAVPDGTGTWDTAGPASPEDGDDYSDTNVQEAGVDEGDLVKTDGRFLYVLSDTGVAIVEADPTDGLDVLSHTPIEGSVHSMYLYEDRVIVLSVLNSYSWWYGPTPLPWMGPIDALAPMAFWSGGPDWREPWTYEPPQVKVTILDVSDRAAPEAGPRGQASMGTLRGAAGEASRQPGAVVSRP